MSKFLNEIDANKILSLNNIPMAKSALIPNINKLKECVATMEFPIVMKILSPDILHKTEAKCVFVEIKTIEEAEKTYNTILENAKTYNKNAEIDGVLVQEMAGKGLEIIFGMKEDPQFGKVIMVGTGGIYVEVFKDISLRLLPITRYDAEEMIRETKAFEIINGARGIQYDIEAVINVLMKISMISQNNVFIEEIDINPFFLYEKGKGGIGVDALIKLIY